MEAIENKIQNARKRIEESKRGKSNKAQITQMKPGEKYNEENMDEYLYGNEDEDDIIA